MMVKKQNNSLIIAIAIVLAAIIIAPHLDFSTTVNQETLEQLETAKDGTCSISLSKNVINAGDTITGNLKDGATTLCVIYGNLDNTGWKKIGEGTTNAFGDLSITDTLNIPGTFEFRAICGSCVTNTVNLVVNPVVTLECTDTDGINKMVPGHVTYDGLSYYDKCTDNVVTEYYCDNGVQSKLLPCDIGYECWATRSGDACILSTPTYAPGDIVWSDSGTGGITGGTLPVTYIDLSDLRLEEGTCRLAVKFNTDWDWVPSGDVCYGIMGYDHPIWDIYDSLGLEYHSTTNTYPNDIQRDLHPETYIWNWDGQTDWKVMVTKAFNIPDCSISYTWDMEVYIYDC